MNANKRVFLFILFSLILYLIVSYLTLAYRKSWDPFDRINLLSEIISSKKTGDDKRSNYQEQVELPPDVDPADTLLASIQDTIVPEQPKADSAITYKQQQKVIPLSNLPENINKKDIILFTEDSAQVALTRFANKLADLKKGKKIKVRIAYLGDSMIEGDLLSQTLRVLLQQTYGGKGVGFVPITSQVAQFRRTALATFSAGWKDLNFKNTKKQHLFLSGHVFFSSGDDWVKIKDNTTKDTTGTLEKYIFYGTSNDSSFITVNKKMVPLEGKGLFNRELLLDSKAKSITISTSDTKLPLYGLSFESEYGVIVDNFSFRGISGLEFARINTNFLKEVDEQNPYDLIIFQYGVNVMYKPDETNFNWYKRAATPVINKMKTSFPQADFLIVGTGDRAFRYPEGYQSAVGIEELIKVQAALAMQTNCAFYSLYAVMGGKNSMVNWATQSPSLANKDYVHPNGLGAKILGKHLFEALNRDVNKLEAN